MMSCCQIAVSSIDLARSHSWYRRVLGFRAAGNRRHLEGPLYAAVPGLPEASFDVWCLVGRSDFVQIEMFEFTRPIMRRRPATWRPCDFGYSMFGIRVPSFPVALERIAAAGVTLLTAPVGARGNRRACVKDPDGIVLELIEDDSRDAATDDLSPAIASVTLSVPDLHRAREFWVGVLGFAEVSTALHSAEHESLWGLGGAQREAVVLDSGSIAIELVQYDAPAGQPRPADYLLSDQGILNVALGSMDKQEFDATYRRAVESGFRGHIEPWTLPDVATVVYLRDTDGMSVELLHVEPHALRRMGFIADDAESQDAPRRVASGTSR